MGQPEPVTGRDLNASTSRDAAYLTGHEHGRTERAIDPALITDPELSGPYRRGLTDGRTVRVDQELIKLITAEELSELTTAYAIRGRKTELRGWQHVTADAPVSGQTGDEVRVRARTQDAPGSASRPVDRRTEGLG